MVRVEPEQTDALLRREHVGPMVMRDKELAGWVRVDDAGSAPSVSSRVGPSRRRAGAFAAAEAVIAE